MKTNMRARSDDSFISDIHENSVPADEDMDDITAIAVMGVTGSGKSNFIKHATSSERIKVGHSLQSCKKPYPFRK